MNRYLNTRKNKEILSRLWRLKNFPMRNQHHVPVSEKATSALRGGLSATRRCSLALKVVKQVT